MNSDAPANAGEPGSYDCLLTLAIPADLEEEVLDHLAGHPQWVEGFTLVNAEGFGSGARLRSTLEQVRGRSRRRLVQLLIRREHVSPLIESLRVGFKTPEMSWWTSPIDGFGRFV